MAKQTREYRSPVRAAAAERTRQAVVDAAAELFSEQGYAPTTMRAIAERAGTSVETVHGHGPKTALLRAAFESRFAPVPETGIGEGETLEPARVERALRPIVRRFADSVGVYRALIAAADTDPQVCALVAELRTVQRNQIGERLRPLLGARARAQTADALALLVSHTAFEHFVTHCGWSPARYRNWAARAICAELG
ncbi:TetR/AcrR family transcriptional regulator [Sciscionella sediminilitoris]|uniref:TetR/AcrR family transcriptional regulator n=1 Tax=Sciscionella sediminilitoris TaxID=1445613 RepID=UPI000560041C|nr:TetR/AcrR family transcriptional regulator [Sciscionella sp. SE31]